MAQGWVFIHFTASAWIVWVAPGPCSEAQPLWAVSSRTGMLGPAAALVPEIMEHVFDYILRLLFEQ